MKKQYFWNTAAGILNAAESIIFGMITNRVTGITDSGILTIAFSVGNLFASVGRWGIRTVQVSDNGSNSFKEYFNARIFSIVMQIFSAFIYVFASGFLNDYSWEKTYVIVLMVLIYASENFEDTFWGHFQKNKHIETGAQVFIIRWISIIFSYSIILILTHSITISMTIATVLSFFVLAISLFIFWRPYKNIKEEYKHEEKKILFNCFPIMLTAFVAFYTLNAAKFSIDSVLGDEDIAIYGFISMPVFAISLFSSFIYNPQILDLSNDFNSKRINRYKKRIAIQIIVILVLTILASIFAWLIGVPVLGWIFAVNLTNYQVELTILVISSGFLAIASYLSVTMVIERRPMFPLIAYSIAALISFFLYRPLIESSGIRGASIGFFVAMIFNAIISIMLELLSLSRTDGKKDKNAH